MSDIGVDAITTIGEFNRWLRGKGKKYSHTFPVPHEKLSAALSFAESHLKHKLHKEQFIAVSGLANLGLKVKQMCGVKSSPSVLDAVKSARRISNRLRKDVKEDV